jgi:hypothetical protein
MDEWLRHRSPIADLAFTSDRAIRGFDPLKKM